jgi:hypothetical protein
MIFQGYDLTHLTPAMQKVAKAIIKKVGEEDSSQTFYTPQEWSARGEDYGRDAEMIVVHDGPPFAPHFNLDYEKYDLHDEMSEVIEATGYWMEACTTWYTAIYKGGE